MTIRKSLKAIKPINTAYYFYKYILFHFKLVIAMFRDWKDRKNPAYVPVPPARLRHRVHGSTEVWIRNHF
jgi:hypothetical protein